MASDHILLLTTDSDLGRTVEALLPPGYTVEILATLERLTVGQEEAALPALVILDSALLAEAISPAEISRSLMQLPVLLLHRQPAEFASLNAWLPYLKVLGIATPPFAREVTRALIATALERAPRYIQQRRLEEDLASANRRLNQRLQEINIIYTVGKSVASSLQVGEVLERVLDAALNFTQAEEGFILLREGDQLFLRAAKDVQESLIQRFNDEVSDNIAWRVIHSGRPVMLKRETKIVTGYLAQALLYVPLRTPERGNIGVLGVVNRLREDGFTEAQLFTLSSIADFVAIALDNARLFSAVEDERSRMRTILRHAAEAILVTDPQNRLLLWSQTAGEIFRLPDDAEGQPVEQVIAHPQLLELLGEAEKSKGIAHAEIALDDGRTFNCQLTIIEPLGQVMVMQDITHLKELDRLKSEFVSTVSHDLRTPLTTIQGYIALLNRVGPLTPQQQSFIHKALDGLDQITNLISDLLDIGRIEAGYDLEMHPLRLDRLLVEVTQFMAVQVEQAGLTLRWAPPPEPLWVLGNARRLRQVLENLISNAIKYNRRGGWIKLEGHREGSHVIVSVHDNGIGIPLEEQPHLFERFYRVRSLETEDIQGTGLGLAIVKSVIEKHKGRVWVESSPSEGSIFSFILPALPEVPQE
ncbi:MAG: hypothetical protein DRI37_01755 [Chloroflexi bacterium]|nr:MAG: hypothetical protein DRI37_01755 [Chloroflexota bacterium]